MEEFMIADNEAVNGRKNFIIIVLKEKLEINKLPKELKTYMKTYTYIDATKNTDKMMKRLRFVITFLKDGFRVSLLLGVCFWLWIYNPDNMSISIN